LEQAWDAAIPATRARYPDPAMRRSRPDRRSLRGSTSCPAIGPPLPTASRANGESIAGRDSMLGEPPSENLRVGSKIERARRGTIFQREGTNSALLAPWVNRCWMGARAKTARPKLGHAAHERRTQVRPRGLHSSPVGEVFPVLAQFVVTTRPQALWSLIIRKSAEGEWDWRKRSAVIVVCHSACRLTCLVPC